MELRAVGSFSNLPPRPGMHRRRVCAPHPHPPPHPPPPPTPPLHSSQIPACCGSSPPWKKRARSWCVGACVWGWWWCVGAWWWWWVVVGGGGGGDLSSVWGRLVSLLVRPLVLPFLMHSLIHAFNTAPAAPTCALHACRPPPRTQVFITEVVFASLSDLLDGAGAAPGAGASCLPPALASERHQLKLSGEARQGGGLTGQHLRQLDADSCTHPHPFRHCGPPPTSTHAAPAHVMLLSQSWS